MPTVAVDKLTVGGSVSDSRCKNPAFHRLRTLAWLQEADRLRNLLPRQTRTILEQQSAGAAWRCGSAGDDGTRFFLRTVPDVISDVSLRLGAEELLLLCSCLALLSAASGLYLRIAPAD